MSRTLGILLILVVAGCQPMDRAAVFVTPARVDERPFPAVTHEPAVRRTFEQYTQGNGYRCHKSMKKVGGYTCRGPKDLHMTFEQRLNGAGYVAGFSWVRSDDRSAEEFRQLVQAFGRSLEGSGAAVEVRMGQFAE